MPIPQPKPNQTESEFLAQCILFLVDEGYPYDQAGAICYNAWEAKEEETDSEEKTTN